MQLISQTKFCKSEYDQVTCIVYNTWTGIMDDELFRSHFEEIRQFSGSHKILAILNDCRQMKGTFTKTNQWFDEVFLPHMIAHGQKCWGMVTNDIFTRFAANSFLALQSKKPMKGKLFGDMPEAKEWIFKTIKEAQAVS